MPISSTSNTTIKHIRRLRRRKEREQSGLFFIEGIRQVTEALQLGAEIATLIVAPDLLTSAFAWETVMSPATPAERIEVTPEVFRHISSREGPQGIGALVRQRWEPLEQVRLGNKLGWVALDAVQDPGNLGTILRTSDAVGCAGVMLLGHSTDPYDPGALRAGMGAVFAQQLVRASFSEFAAWKQQYGYQVVGTSDAATMDYQECRYQPPLVLLMGSERLGLALEQQALCNQMVRIPMVGRSDSLNLAVATGVMLYELFNQNRGFQGLRVGD